MKAYQGKPEFQDVKRIQFDGSTEEVADDCSSTLRHVPTRVPTAADQDEWQTGLVDESCIFCEPEESRILFESDNFLCLAGAGPICAGYSILAPKSHIPTIAQLPDHLVTEFKACERILMQALAVCYADGITYYEHGRVGSCRWAEQVKVTGHHCFHAHRLYLPGYWDRTAMVQSRFTEMRDLRSANELFGLSDPYVFYACRDSQRQFARVFLNPMHVPSQFMRRVLSTATGKPDCWDWAQNPNWSQVRETVVLVRQTIRQHIVPVRRWSEMTVNLGTE